MAAVNPCQPGTIEHRLKFGLGLPIGVSTIEIRRGAVTRRALVDIGTRGAVYLLPEPVDGDMYITWERLAGDKFDRKKLRMVGVAYVHKARILESFGEPVAVLDIPPATAAPEQGGTL